MKKIILPLIAVLAMIGFESCSTSSDVVTNAKIQKRKYTKGYHVKNVFTKNHKKSTLTSSAVNDQKGNVTNIKTKAPEVFASNSNTLNLKSNTPKVNTTKSVVKTEKQKLSKLILPKAETKKELKTQIKEIKETLKSAKASEFEWGKWALIGILGGLGLILIGAIIVVISGGLGLGGWVLYFLGGLLWIFGWICFFGWLINKIAG